MTVKSILLAFCMLFCTSLAGAQSQAAMTYQTGVTDITSYLPTVNAWVALATPPVAASSLTIGGDGFVAFLGPLNGNGRGAIYTYDRETRLYTQQTSWGTVHQIAAGGATNVWSLQPSTACPTGNYAVQYLNFSTMTWVQPGGCGVFVRTSPDGTVVLLDSSGKLWELQPNYSWTQISVGSSGPYLSYVSVASASSMCGVGGGVVYTFDGTGFTQLATQPGGTPVGCVMTQLKPILATWNAAGVVRLYNFTAGTWSTVTGSMFGLTAASKAMILGLNSMGNPYHLNVYAGYMASTLSGPANSTWPMSPTTHDYKVTMSFPHGMHSNVMGEVKQASNLPYNVNSFDFSAACDTLMGDPSSSECVPNVAASINCPIVGTLFSGGTGETQPPPGPPAFRPFRYLHSWDGYRTAIWYPIPGGFGATATCGATIETCQVPTTSACAPYVPQYEIFDAEGVGPAITPYGMEQTALAQCDFGDPALGRAWAVIGVYNPNDPGGPGSCVPTTVLPSVADTPCR